MELTIRDWMVIIGVILILAVAFDAWRRVRIERRSRVSIKLTTDDVNDASGDDDLSMFKELPNGGARVVERRDLIKAAAKSAAHTAAMQDMGVEEEPPAARTRQTQTRPAAAQQPQPRPKTAAKPAPKPPSKTKVEPKQPTEAEPRSRPKRVAEPPAPGDDGSLVTGMTATDKDGEPRTLDWLDGMDNDSTVDDQQAPAQPEPLPEAGTLPRAVDPEVFMLNVVARNKEGFRGEDILHILLACDLRFGDMNFFHRHEFEAGRGAIQFSVANMMQPGVFDIDNMADFDTPGLVFFLTLPGPEDMMKAFDYMLETARAVARNLGGDVLDESRSVLTKQTLEHCRQQIRDLERRLLARAR